MAIYSQLHRDTVTQPALFTPVTPISPSRKLLSIVQQTQHPFGSPEHLATFVVTTLFDALAGFLFANKSSIVNVDANMLIWHNVYRYVKGVLIDVPWVFSKFNHIICWDHRISKLSDMHISMYYVALEKAFSDVII